MKTIIGVILIVGALVLGYLGVQKWNESNRDISIGKLELSADNTSGKNTSYLYLGGAVILLAGGIFVIRK